MFVDKNVEMDKAKLVERFLDENPEYRDNSLLRLSTENLAGNFDSLEEIVNCFLDCWEDRFDEMTDTEIIYNVETRAREEILVVPSPIKSQWLVFTEPYRALASKK